MDLERQKDEMSRLCFQKTIIRQSRIGYVDTSTSIENYGSTNEATEKEEMDLSDIEDFTDDEEKKKMDAIQKQETLIKMMEDLLKV